MHVVVDAVAVRPGSTAVILENLLPGWLSLAHGDRITVLVDRVAHFRVPSDVEVVVVPRPVGGPLGNPLSGLWLRSVGVRLAAHALDPDAVLSAVPASTLAGVPSARGIVLCDLRHELRPRQFSLARRLARRLSWGWSMHRADSIYCISDRTLNDLAHLHPRLAAKAVVARCGSDHVDAWPHSEENERPYALAFGQFANKNVSAVLEGWARLCATDDRLTLRLVGMSHADRERTAAQVSELGIESRVELMPWLDDDAFARCFGGAELIVFPSDFEGFGLPAIEALRLGIPVVISDDPALAEVTGGHAVVTQRLGPDDLADAMRAALATTETERAAGRAFTDEFQWRAMAAAIRNGLARHRAIA